MEKNTGLIKSKVKSSMIQLVIAVCGVFVAVFGLSMFNQHLLMSFPLPLRMVLMIFTQWLLFLVPAILMIVNKEKLSSIGFKKEKILSQIGIGVLLALEELKAIAEVMDVKFEQAFILPDGNEIKAGNE
jgi:hypothetical protein